jgi:hypothetical protein
MWEFWSMSVGFFTGIGERRRPMGRELELENMGREMYYSVCFLQEFIDFVHGGDVRVWNWRCGAGGQVGV